MLALVKLMPKYFSELPSTYFLETYGFYKGSVPAPNPKASDEVPIQYLKHRITGLTHEEWYELPYRRNSYPITGSAVTLPGGLVVRSKTEASMILKIRFYGVRGSMSFFWYFSQTTTIFRTKKEECEKWKIIFHTPFFILDWVTPRLLPDLYSVFRSDVHAVAFLNVV